MKKGTLSFTSNTLTVNGAVDLLTLGPLPLWSAAVIVNCGQKPTYHLLESNVTNYSFLLLFLSKTIHVYLALRLKFYVNKQAVLAECFLADPELAYRVYCSQFPGLSICFCFSISVMQSALCAPFKLPFMSVALYQESTCGWHSLLIFSKLLS